MKEQAAITQHNK